MSRILQECLPGVAYGEAWKTPPWANPSSLPAMPGKKMPPNNRSVRSQVVGFGSGQGLNVFETAGIADAMSRTSQERKHSSGPKDAAKLKSVRSQAVGFGSGQGLNVFETADIADAILRISKK